MMADLDRNMVERAHASAYGAALMRCVQGCDGLCADCADMVEDAVTAAMETLMTELLALVTAP